LRRAGWVTETARCPRGQAMWAASGLCATGSTTTRCRRAMVPAMC
jgi:hypothetical protein